MRTTTTIFIMVAGWLFLNISCDDDFLVRAPLDTPSLSTFWETPEQAELWVNNLYNGLEGSYNSIFEVFSDNAYGRAGTGANQIAQGSFTTDDNHVNRFWSYRYIRLCHEYFENVDNVTNISESKKTELSAQVRFMLAYQYYILTTLYRDVPLVKTALSIDESDVEVNSKEEVLQYIFDQLDYAIENLPVTWPASETGRVTKGAALSLKARVALYDDQWELAKNAAKQVMDLDVYSLHPTYKEIFRQDFNNQTNEVILAHQYAKEVNTHDLVRNYAPVYLGGYALMLPTDELQQSFEMEDGSKFNWNNPEHVAKPYTNRDPRFYDTFNYHGRDYNGAKIDLTESEFRFAFTYLYYRKYVDDLIDREYRTYVNWIIFRYADVLLMYAEAQNEISGPDDNIYEALDLIRERADMPGVNRNLYSDQASLREFIRNERRVELAGEGLRYFDIIRWGIAEDVLNKDIKSMDLDHWVDRPVDDSGNSLLPVKSIQSRVFDPSKHYVWPIPQDAIDRSENLVQHPEWK